jgi:ABC-type metal ion transport system substrate-binding protein
VPTSRSTLGLNPVQDALAYEAIDSEYVNVLVTDSARASNSDLQKLGTALVLKAQKRSSPSTTRERFFRLSNNDHV